jgi:hypothetical protein
MPDHFEPSDLGLHPSLVFLFYFFFFFFFFFFSLHAPLLFFYTKIGALLRKSGNLRGFP